MGAEIINKLLINIKTGALYSMLDGDKCGGNKREQGRRSGWRVLKFLLNYMYPQKPTYVFIRKA